MASIDTLLNDDLSTCLAICIGSGSHYDVVMTNPQGGSPQPHDPPSPHGPPSAVPPATPANQPWQQPGPSSPTGPPPAMPAPQYPPGQFPPAGSPQTFGPPPELPPPGKGPASGDGLKVAGIIAGIVLVTVLLSIGSFLTLASPASDSNSASDSSSDGKGDADKKPGNHEPKADNENFGLVFGSGDVKIDIYVDFMCPSCADFDEENGKSLAMAANGNDATVTIHPIAMFDDHSDGSKYSTRSAAASVCAADQGAQPFFSYMSSVMKLQPKDGSAGPDDDVLIDKGEELGAEFADCVKQGTYKKWVATSTKAARDQGVDAVPTTFFDRAEVPPHAFGEKFEQVVRG